MTVNTEKMFKVCQICFNVQITKGNEFIVYVGQLP